STGSRTTKYLATPLNLLIDRSAGANGPHLCLRAKRLKLPSAHLGLMALRTALEPHFAGAHTSIFLLESRYHCLKVLASMANSGIIAPSARACRTGQFRACHRTQARPWSCTTRTAARTSAHRSEHQHLAHNRGRLAR